jgi:hypothetical protein
MTTMGFLFIGALGVEESAGREPQGLQRKKRFFFSVWVHNVE